ncbi:MAG: low molecular weight protein-tyrosine-phosphatase [Tractidigestivibacter sp.]|jgi:protein-tyrosine phosphatase|uniref:low molecular weight protein-tyrosine-phosphatase n=1 Tax=Tractidigestivibacter sp. TaxID=2847320 RepID=UPI003D9107FF
MPSVLFICHGNICRSTMAQFVLEDMARRAGESDRYLIDSAATHTDEIGSGPHYGTVRKLREEGISVGEHVARLVSKGDYERFDHIVYMDAENRHALLRVFGGDPNGKLSRLLDWAGIHRDVADPWYTGDFDATFDDVMAGCKALFSALQAGEEL